MPHSIHQTVNLPLSLVIKPCPPVKDADFKVFTISNNILIIAININYINKETLIAINNTNSIFTLNYNIPNLIITLLQVTVSTNKPAVSLLELFPEFVLDR